MAQVSLRIIIHGKCNDTPQPASSAGLDTAFAENIANGFFSQSGNVATGEHLFVDIRRWNGTTYSVYTYLIKGIAETSGRPNSYFALTVVLSNGYFHLISELFRTLQKICREDVGNRYIDFRQQRYIVDNFDNKSYFQAIESQVAVYNDLFDPISNQAVSYSGSSKSLGWNVNDCNSPAFFDALFHNGRIEVSETYPMQSVIASKMETERNSFEQQLNAKKAKVSELTKLVQQLQNDNRRYSEGSANREIENKKLKLNVEKLKRELQDSNDKISQLESKLDKVREIVGENVVRDSYARSESRRRESNKNVNKHIDDVSLTEFLKKWLKKWWLLIILILMIVILLIVHFYPNFGSISEEEADRDSIIYNNEEKYGNQQVANNEEYMYLTDENDGKVDLNQKIRIGMPLKLHSPKGKITAKNLYASLSENDSTFYAIPEDPSKPIVIKLDDGKDSLVVNVARLSY